MSDGVVVYQYEKLQEYYPELNASFAKGQWAFEMATCIINNTPRAFVCCECLREKALYLLAAHILFLNNRGAGNIGTIGNASEGSVSVGYSTSSIDKLGAGWFSQSQYGLLFWQMMAQFRSGFYVP